MKNMIKNMDKDRLISKLLTLGIWVNALILLLVGWVYTEVVWGISALSVTLMALLGFAAYRNQAMLRKAAGSRSARYGANSLLTTGLVAGILVVVNFLNYNHGWKKDLTKTGVHTLSEQTVKLLKELKTDVKATVYVKAQGREQAKSLIDKYRDHTKKLSAEYVDPDRDPGRAKAANVKKYNTVVFESGGKESRVEDISEEKFTNALIKLSRSKTVTMCVLTGHGERGLDEQTNDGYTTVKAEMGVSSWETKVVNLLEEGKVPEVCSVLLVLGPTKAFFDKEFTVLGEWIDNGGRALFAVDPDIERGSNRNDQINKFLSQWRVRVRHDIVIDPLSRLLGAEANVPIVPTYNKDHVITKDFQATALFPLASSVEILDGDSSGLRVQWLAKSTPKSFAETDFKELAKGKAQQDAGKDKQGPLDMVVAIEGRRNNSAKAPTRMVVFGTSALASNAYARHAQNIDLFLNTASWLADDESLISIRPKEETGQAITLSQTEGRYIQLLTMMLVPLFSFGTGIASYVRRRKL